MQSAVPGLQTVLEEVWPGSEVTGRVLACPVSRVAANWRVGSWVMQRVAGYHHPWLAVASAVVGAAGAVAVIRRVVWPWVVSDLKVRGVLGPLVLMAVSLHCYFVAVEDGWDPDCAALVVAVALLPVVVRVWVRCFRDPRVCS